MVRANCDAGAVTSFDRPAKDYAIFLPAIPRKGLCCTFVGRLPGLARRKFSWLHGLEPAKWFGYDVRPATKDMAIRTYVGNEMRTVDGFAERETLRREKD